MKSSILNYCANLGKHSLLVQGAGGNVSWKEEATLWIKASGTWLAHAESDNIFIPVDLTHLQNAINTGDYFVTPRTLSPSRLRPSIETLLHALMPHRIVIHLHAVEILALLVRKDAERVLYDHINPSLSWCLVDYYKPGPELAKAVRLALDNDPNSQVIFLKNHGIVIGGDSISEIDHILQTLAVKPISSAITWSSIKPPELPFTTIGKVRYIPISDPAIHQLATHADLFERLKQDWALYPDHIVFLGSAPRQYDSMNLAILDLNDPFSIYDVIFIRNVGVFTRDVVNASKQAQLRCYFEILSRQPKNKPLQILEAHQIAELLDWDAEQYRISLTTTTEQTI